MYAPTMHTGNQPQHQQFDRFSGAGSFPQGQAQPGLAGHGYQHPAWHQPRPRRNTTMIVAIAAIVGLVLAAVAVVLIVTLGGSSNPAPAPNGQSQQQVPGPNNQPAPGPNNQPAPGPNNQPAPGPNNQPAAGGMSARATAERVAALASNGQGNAAGAYVCAAQRQQFAATINSVPAGTVTITVVDVVENGATATATLTISAADPQTGQTRQQTDKAMMHLNAAGAWILCDTGLGEQDQGVPNEAAAGANVPAGNTVPAGNGQAQQGGQPSAEQAVQVAQAWAAAVSAGDTAGARQFLCSAAQNGSGDVTTPGIQLSLSGIEEVGQGQGRAQAEFDVAVNGQPQGTASVAMVVENGTWTMCM